MDDRSAAVAPVEDYEQTFADDRAYVLQTWSVQEERSMPLITHASGCYIYGSDGSKYLDFHAQFGNVNIGHSHPHVLRVMREQLEKLQYVSPAFVNTERARLARRIAELTPGNLTKSLFISSGAEANDNAIKIARMITHRQKIMARYHSYHGATYGAISVTGGLGRRPPVEPGITGVVHCYQPYRYRCLFCRQSEKCTLACYQHLEETVELEGPETIAAIIVEPITGSAGVIIPPAEYMPLVRELCDAYGIILIADEVMSGWGRTGKWFACDLWGVVPDILTTSKGITAGYIPLSTTVVTEEIASFFEDHTLWAGATASGHPLACAVANATIDVYEQEDLISRSAELGDELLRILVEMADRQEAVGDVRGVGLFCALELVRDRESREPLLVSRNGQSTAKLIQSECMKRGLYVQAHSNVVSVAPPLIISREQLEWGVSVLEEVLSTLV